ncbi:helix-turn-helix domain-containing protein [Streptomyces sp. NPDC014991]|uniref:helix-turn-helix domain-containing protein n=1 Tax=Streptomyces sp. NPDC014991 TaxID=3364935 RepID=UPI0037006AB5
MQPTRHPLGDTTRHVGLTVRDLRERQGISTTVMAERLTALGRRIAQSGVTRLEAGQRRIDVDDLTALAAVLGVRPASLLPSGAPLDPCASGEHAYDNREISGPGPRVCNDCGHTEDLED